MAEALWKIAIRRAVEALDWRCNRSAEGMPLFAFTTRPLNDQMATRARNAAIEIDKMVAAAEPGDEEVMGAASVARRRLADLQANEPTEYDAILAAKAAYCVALVEAIWRMVEDAPARKLAGWAAAQED